MKSIISLQAILLVCLSIFSTFSLAGDRPAVLDWFQRIELSTPVSGMVRQVHVDVGDQVKKGQTLVTLDDRSFRARITKAKGVLVRATETFTEAEREKVRGQELFDRSSISVHDQQLINIEFSKADAQLREARAEVVLAKLDLEYSVIRSPVNGVVVQKLANNGQTVVSNMQANTLIVVADNTRMVARAQLGAEVLRGLKAGGPLSVKVSGKIFSGRIASLGQEPSGQSRVPLYFLDVVFEAVHGGFRKGQPALIILP